MSFEEAIDWLDKRGGRWSARASRSVVQVVVTLGSRQVRATVDRLHAEEVRLALVDAVKRMRERLAA